MPDLRWTEGANQYESLAVSLRALVTKFDRDRPYEEFVAMLGLGAITVAVDDEPLGWWSSFGRDVYLADVAARYGMRLRELHPPPAAAGLQHAVGFAQHFRDSYAPLIKTALEHEQYVLLWRGWPPPRDRLWGVLTAQRSGMLIGYTLWHDGNEIPLLGSAHQVYVVEGFDHEIAGRLDAPARFHEVCTRAVDHWRRSVEPNYGIRTGAAAYDAWCAALHSGTAADQIPLEHQQHSQARTYISARRSLAYWLRTIAGQLSPADLTLAARWANACDQLCETLAPYESAEVIRTTLAAADGFDRICSAIAEAKQIEHEAIARLADAISHD